MIPREEEDELKPGELLAKPVEQPVIYCRANVPKQGKYGCHRGKIVVVESQFGRVCATVSLSGTGRASLDLEVEVAKKLDADWHCICDLQH